MVTFPPVGFGQCEGSGAWIRPMFTHHSIHPMDSRYLSAPSPYRRSNRSWALRAGAQKVIGRRSVSSFDSIIARRPGDPPARPAENSGRQQQEIIRIVTASLAAGPIVLIARTA